MIENDALVLLYINEIPKNIKKGPWEYLHLQWLREEKWPFHMNSVCVDCGHRIFGVGCYQWSRRGIWCEHQMCVLTIRFNGKWGRLISRIFMIGTFADVKILYRLFAVLKIV